MVKAPTGKKAQRFRGRAATATPVVKTPQVAPSRGQRKRAVKRARIVGKLELADEIAKQQKVRPKKKGLQELSSDFLDALDDVQAGETEHGRDDGQVPRSKAKTAPFSRVVRNKGKSTVAALELEQLQVVLTHPAFQQNPFASIQRHLAGTAASRQTPDHAAAAAAPSKTGKQPKPKEASSKGRRPTAARAKHAKKGFRR